MNVQSANRITRPPKARPQTMADVLRRLGVSANRVRCDVNPGHATVRDLLKFQATDDRLYELVDGYLVKKGMGAGESFIGGKVFRFIDSFLDDHDLGFVLGPDGSLRILPQLVRMADVAFISWDQRPERTIPSEPVPELFPDLAVEVLSESNTKVEMARKLREYYEAGTRLVWFIDPRTRTATVYTSPTESTVVLESGTLTGGDVLPGFTLPLRKLFAKLEKPKAKRRRK